MNGPAQSEPAVRLVGVGRTYRSGDQTIDALSDVSLELYSGHVTALVGPSGSGKTTLVNLLIEAERPDTGSIARRADISTGWHDLAFVPQGLGLLDELTVAENVGLANRLRIRGATPVHQLLERLDLSELANRFPSEISIGEQQRVAVARAVVSDPKLVVVDEPTAHQDELRSEAVLQELINLGERGASVLIATHEQRILDRVGTVFSMVDGRLTARTVQDASISK